MHRLAIALLCAFAIAAQAAPSVTQLPPGVAFKGDFEQATVGPMPKATTSSWSACAATTASTRPTT